MKTSQINTTVEKEGKKKFEDLLCWQTPETFNIQHSTPNPSATSGLTPTVTPSVTNTLTPTVTPTQTITPTIADTLTITVTLFLIVSKLTV